MKHLKALLFTLCFACSFLFSYPVPTYASDTILQGIDVSEWEGTIDFESVKESGIDVVYIRAAEGGDYEDQYFVSHYKGAKAAGLKIGFYHYITATSISEAKQQAQYFYSLIKDKDMDCLPAMDYESFSNLSNDEINLIATAYLDTLESLIGISPAIYSDASNAANVWSESLTYYPLWVANYGVSEPQSIGNWSEWVGFQYSDTGNINGITGDVDLDYFKEGIFIDSPGTDSPTSNTTSSSSTTTQNSITYVVQSGDTLSQIAQTYNVTVQAIVVLNNISNPNLIYPGEVLQIPSSTTHNRAPHITFITPTPLTSTTSYTVQSGDTLSQIAQDYNVTVQAIVSLNNISNPNFIYPGQVVLIPSSTPSSSSPSTLSYTVESGDTLWNIAVNNNTTVAELVSLNHLSNANLIYPGQVLLLPN